MGCANIHVDATKRTAPLLTAPRSHAVRRAASRITRTSPKPRNSPETGRCPEHSRSATNFAFLSTNGRQHADALVEDGQTSHDYKWPDSPLRSESPLHATRCSARGTATTDPTMSTSTTHRNGARRLADALDQPVQAVTARVADRLIEAVERDAEAPSDSPLATDERRQQLLVGAWINDEINVVNEDRLRSGLRPLDLEAEQTLRARVVADLTGSGPLEPYLNDENVEEIDVNSATSTWVTFADGHKVDVGALWNSTAELIAFQKRLALRMKGTGEGRLDTSSPMLTMQSNEGSRIVMVLGGDSEHGISTHPRIAIRRFVVRQAGLEGLAKLGLFPIELTAQLRALVRCGFTMLISGPPGAGKTTLLTELLGEVSPLERIITVEKNLLELRLEDDPRHPDAPALFTRHANLE